jgi:hypothetical protein
MTNQVTGPELEQNSANEQHSDGWMGWEENDSVVTGHILWLAVVRDATLHAEKEAFKIMCNEEANQAYAERRHMSKYDVIKQTMEVCRRWLTVYEMLENSVLADQERNTSQT